MKLKQYLVFLVYYMPLSVFAHPGHPEWIKTSESGHVEIYEALLFVIVLAYFAISKNINRSKKMFKSRHNKH
jgi:hypothetical protein